MNAQYQDFANVILPTYLAPKIATTGNDFKSSLISYPTNKFI
jgi:hypothetical protein